MKIIQLLPTISFGDAVGNDTLALKKAISDLGFETGIYAENIDGRLPAGTARHISELDSLSPDDIVIYHNSTGTALSFELDRYPGHKMMIYHNITPPHFFSRYSARSAELSRYGLDGMKYLADKVEYCMADSDFNRQELLDAGYRCRIDVRPILIPFDDYRKKPDESVVKQYSDGYINILFVGRIAPNKKQEDLIRTFYFYKKHINSRSRLILAGSYTGMESYYERLQSYVKTLGLEDDVVFTGHTSFAAILAYYRTADIFLCMSEHEGFCVPLVEAMFFDVPVLAYSSCAVPYTMGGSGVVVNTKDPAETAMLTDRILKDSSLREKILNSQRERLKDFSCESVSQIFSTQLKKYIDSLNLNTEE